MRKLVTTLCAMACLAVGLQAQNITVTSAVGQTPAAFIQNNLLGGGVYIFNAKFSNSASAISTDNIGTFQANGFMGLMMMDGVLMTTGNISVAPGPNNMSGSSNAIAGYYSDPEMENVATSTINGCSTLDFDFVTLSNSVSFNYCFASEEYPEYVCSNFNDVFAFFVTGPDPETGEEVTRNIAIIPGTVSDATPNGIAVAINSVNIGTAGTYGGTGQGCYYDYSSYYVENPTDSTGIQYDGYTSKLSATAAIVPCEVYHMHISVCNVGDNAYDSGVFLEGNSFTANTAAIGLSRPGITPLHGSCPTNIPLSLATTDYSQGTVQFSFGGTAVEGVDFELTDEYGVPFDSLGMSIDNDTHSFVIHGLPNADLTTAKTIDVYLATSLCAAFPSLVAYDTMHFTLDRGGDVRVKDSTISCAQVCFEVGTELIYGTNVSYRWEPTTGLDDPYSLTTSAMIFESRDYQLIATGGSGCNSDTADVHVVITGNGPDIPVGIDEGALDGVSVWPNPANDVIHIAAEGLQHIEVYTVEGRKVWEQTYNGLTGTVDLPTEGLAAGVYAIRVSTANGVSGNKIVVNK